MFLSLIRRSALATTVMLAFSAPAYSQSGRNMLPGSISSMAPFDISFRGSTQTAKTGDFTPPWTANVWDQNSTGEVFLRKLTVRGSRCVGLSNISGKGAVQFYMWQPLPLASGRRYSVCCEYQASGSTNGSLTISGVGVTKIVKPLVTTKSWTVVKASISQRTKGALILNFQNYSVGPKELLYLKDIQVIDAGPMK